MTLPRRAFDMTLASPITTYGADMSGLICAFRFLPGEKAQPVSSDDAIEWLREQGIDEASETIASAPQSQARDRSFIWLHFNLAHAASDHWLRTHLTLPDEFYEALAEGARSTRIEQQEGALLSVINDVMLDFNASPSQVATLWAYTHERLLVTARMKPLQSVDKLREVVRHGEIFESPFELVVHLMRDQADLMARIMRRTSADVDRAEDQFLASRRYAKRQDLAAMRRVLVRLQRMLAPEPGAMFRLLARPPRWLQSSDIQNLRETTEEFSLVLNDMAGLTERIKLLQEEIGARLEEQNNHTLFTLTLVTVLALPINIVAGLLGMNVGGIPLAENKHGFWLMLLIVAGFTALAGWWVFRRRRE